MTISRSPSTTSLMSHAPRPGVGALWGTLTSFFSPRGTPRPEESQESESDYSQSYFGSTQAPTPYGHEPPPSQSAGPSQPSQFIPSAVIVTERPKPAPPPIFKARDFALEPPPKIKHGPVDPMWVVPFNLPKDPVPGTRERFGKNWEDTDGKRLFRVGNRADPPGTIPKTWGGLSKAEDKEMMSQAQARVLEAQRAKQAAAAFGLTPTEPNLDGPPPVPPLPQNADREAAARADAYQREQEARALAAGHGPLIKTPPNSPPPEPRRRGLPPLPLPPQPRSPAPRTPSPRRARPKRAKRKLDESGSEREDAKETRGRARKRQNHQEQHSDEEVAMAEVGPSTPVRYTLRQRYADGTTTPSPKNSPNGKGKGKARAR